MKVVLGRHIVLHFRQNNKTFQEIKFQDYTLFGSRGDQDSSVSIVTRLLARRPGFGSLQEK